MQQPDNVLTSQLPPAPEYGFVGRTQNISDLSISLSTLPIALIIGKPGIGKTDLALHYARISEADLTYPGGIIYSQITVGSSFQKLIHETGTSIFGISFGDLNHDEQYEALSKHLMENATLLIWDDVNYASSVWEEGELEKLKKYLATWEPETPSNIVLISQTKDSVDVPSTNANTISVPKFDQNDFQELASAFIGSIYGDDPSKPAVSQLESLLHKLEGHPLALQIILPLLKDSPVNIIESELLKQIETNQDILRSSFETFYGRASYRVRTHLPIISLFKKRVMLDVLTHFTQSASYKAVFKEELGWGATRALLRGSKESGVLASISPSVYLIPNSIPPLLGEKLYRTQSAEAISNLEQEFTRIYADTADHFLESLDENPDSGTTAILAEEENFYQALGLALEAKDWESSQILMQPVAQVYKMQKRFIELDLLREQVLNTIGLTYSSALDNNSIELWEYIKGTTSSDLIEQNKISEGTEICHELLDYLENNQPDNQELKLATVYSQLGEIHLLTRELDASEEYFSKANDIYQTLEAEDNSAEISQYLGRIRYFQGRYSDAKAEYNKALEIHQQFEDQEQMVVDYRFLGLLSQLQLKYEEAESWYKQAQSIVENYGDEETAMLVYHDLGTVFHAQYFFEEAQSWYRQALHLADRLGFQGQMAREFHYLGLLSQDRGELQDEAEEWLVAALDIKTQLGDYTGCGDECRQIALLYHEQEQFSTAEEWYRKAIDFFQMSSNVDKLARTYGQMGIIKQELGDIEGSLEWGARTYTLVNNSKLPILSQVINHLATIRKEIGEATFDQWWLNQFDEESPIDDSIGENEGQHE